MIVLLSLLSLTSLFAAGSAIVETYSLIGNNSGMSVLSFAWTTDDSTGSVYTSTGVNLTVSSTIAEAIAGKYVIMAETNPTNSPTDNYDVYIRDTDGVDVLGLALANCDTTNSEQWLLPLPRPITSDLKLEVLTAGNSKSGVVKLTLSRQR
jgi:hypothetical protein